MAKSGPEIPSGNPGRFSILWALITWPPGISRSSTTVLMPARLA